MSRLSGLKGRRADSCVVVYCTKRELRCSEITSSKCPCMHFHNSFIDKQNPEMSYTYAINTTKVRGQAAPICWLPFFHLPVQHIKHL